MLGVTFDNDLKWESQVFGKGGIIASLNQRLHFLRRLKNFINKEALKKVANSIFNSKVRYGLQLIGRVRWSSEDSVQGNLKAVQKIQNKMLRLLNGSNLIDKISTKTLLEKANMLSVNQTNAQIKITHVWKALQDPNHPLKIERVSHETTAYLTRAQANGDLKEFGKSNIVQSTFLSDACHIWNKCPRNIKDCDTLWKAKKTIRSFVATLPI